MSGTPPQNPYAPPSDFGILPVPPVAPGALGGPRPWDVGEVLSVAWGEFKKQWVVLVLVVFLPALLRGIPQSIPSLLTLTHVVEPDSVEYFGVLGVCSLIGMLIFTFFQVGSLRIFLAVARGQQAELGTLFSGADRFLALLATFVIQMLAVLIASLFLIVPGVILGIGLTLSQFYCVDGRLGPIESLRASWDATQGQKGKIFLFYMLAVCVIIAGIAACCIGVYPALSVVWVALSIVYVRLSGRNAAA